MKQLTLQDMFQNTSKHEFQPQPLPSTSGMYISADLASSTDNPDDIITDYAT
jgi:hypothetical protein